MREVTGAEVDRIEGDDVGGTRLLVAVVVVGRVEPELIDPIDRKGGGILRDPSPTRPPLTPADRGEEGDASPIGEEDVPVVDDPAVDDDEMDLPFIEAEG